MAHPKKNTGLTIVEVLVTTAVFSVCALSLLNLVVAHAHDMQRSQNRLVASAIAQGVMEQQLSLGFACRDLDKQTVSASRGIDAATEELRFQTQSSITDTSGGGAPIFKIITVKVSWTEEQQERSVSLQNYVSWQN